MLKYLSYISFLVLLTITDGNQALNAAPIRVVTFNVLAPLWADPLIYPEGSNLDREFRRGRIIATLNDLKANADIIALQEVTESEFPYFLAGLGNDWVGFAAYHDQDYWSSYLTDGLLVLRGAKRR